MAGHSKWANIQHRKGRQDAKRGKLFTKLIREITVAAKLGGADSDANPRLRAAIDNGLSNNMTKETIDRAVKRGAGSDESDNVDEIRYEGYGPGGVAIIVDTMTDNKNRTVAEIRHAFTKFGGNLGTDGSVSYLFTKIGLISFSNKIDEDNIMEIALDAGAEDIVTNGDKSIDIMTGSDNLIDVKEAVIAAGLKPENAEITMRASTTNELDKKGAETMIKLLDALDDLDDVQKVYSNAEIPDEILAELN
ncbi:MAG: YebC/PmpR family DNA-binding transcriptional regulator [Gammaproteobacteria bacterium]